MAHLTSETILRIVHLYCQNTSIAKISAVVDVSEISISKNLKKLGIEIRKINYGSKNLDPTLINRLYHDEKKSTYEIATQLGCSDETVRKLINNMRDEVTRNTMGSHKEDPIKKSERCKALWQDPEYVAKVQAGISTPEYIEDKRQKGKENCQHLVEWSKSAHGRIAVAVLAKQRWEDPIYRALQTARSCQETEMRHEALRAALADPEKRERWLTKIRRHSQLRQRQSGFISTTQHQLYYMLEISNITYLKEGFETAVGPYTVDCIIPKQQQMQKPLIIEVQGEYWHSIPQVQVRDRQKATYVRKWTDYDLLPLSELNLTSLEAVQNVLGKYGMTIAGTKCTTKDLIIKRIPESDANLFYAIFHYAKAARKGAITYAAFLNENLVAAVSYTYPIRQESAIRLGCKYHEVMEISRLARRTDIQCANLASYLIGRTRNHLPPTVLKLLSFSDETYGHNGGVYAAAGFTKDGVLDPDYWYEDANDARFHKKTIWDRAKRMKFSEIEYAEKHSLMRVFGKSKTRWLYDLKR